VGEVAKKNPNGKA